VKLPFPDLPNSSMADPSFSSLGHELKPAASLHPPSNDASLANLFVPLISITPSNVCPLTVYDRNGFKAMLHFSREPAPGRPDVLVMVLSMLSTSAQPITDIVFQAAVPKTMEIKLQPASGSELPAFSPLLPPAVVSQVLLLANPHRSPVRLRYRLAFRLGAQPLAEEGELSGLPRAPGAAQGGS
ncbi:GGA2 protein, partial [Penelope pileata]|nr:GGA2 protein [Penelope pileata]